MKHERLIENVENGAELLQALSLDKRLHILCLLAEEEVGVSTLARQVGVPQAALSHQLSILRRLGLVTARREGQQVFYRCDEAANKLLSAVSGLFEAR